MSGVIDDACGKSCQVRWGLPKPFDLFRGALQERGNGFKGAFWPDACQSTLLEDLPEADRRSKISPALPADCSAL